VPDPCGNSVPVKSERAVLSGERDSPDWFVKLAYQALYAAKHSGQDRVVSADKAQGRLQGRDVSA
jgi:hypothetical protein